MTVEEAQVILGIFERPMRELKKNGNDAYFIPGARRLLRNEWNDPYIWAGGYVANENDISDYICEMLKKLHGEHEAVEIEEDTARYVEFMKQEKDSISDYIIEVGEKMSFEEAYKKYAAWY